MKTTFYNGKIYAEFYPTVRTIQAFVVEDGRIIFTGTNEMALKISEGGVNLKGKTVLPGFIDAHLHLYEIGMSLNNLDLRGTGSIKEFREKVETYAMKTKGMIVGWGWDQELFVEKRWPEKSDVDDIVKDRPLLLSRLDGHSALANSNLLKTIGIDSKSGIIKEAEADDARRKMDEMTSKETRLTYLVDAIDHLIANGVTTAGYVSCDKKSFDILKELNEERRLPIRVCAYVNPEDFMDVRNFKDTEKLRLKGIKLFADGSLGSWTALLTSRYKDLDSYGEQAMQLHLLKHYSRLCEDSGKKVAIHAIGDAGMDLALLALSDLGPGHRIEHCAVVRDDQLEKSGGINMVVQPHFIHTDFWLLDRLGNNRAKWAYRFSDFLKKGLNVSFSTDSPVEPVNPFLGIYSAITRGDYEGIPLANLTKDQNLTISEALGCYTKGSAIALQEEEIGVLREGNCADFIVTDIDPFTTDFKDLVKAKIEETYVGGRSVKK